MTPNIGIAEVEIIGGSANSTEYVPYGPPTENAFDFFQELSWSGSDVVFPAILWYEFPANAAFIPARVSFRPAHKGMMDQGPTMWQFVGSNDEECGRFSAWTVICEDLSDTGYQSMSWTKYCDASDDWRMSRRTSWKTYRCLGISILNNRNTLGHVALRDIRMWKKVVTD